MSFPAPPPALPARRLRLRTRAPGGARRGPSHPPPDPPGRAAPGRSPEALRSLEDLEHLLRRMEEQLGIRLRIAPALRRGAQHARHPHALRGAAGALPARPARRFPPPSAAAWRSARKSPTPCSTPMTCCATPEGTERQEGCRSRPGGLQSNRRITPMALFALQATADAGEPRVRLNPWRDWPPRRGSARRLRLHVAEHRLQAEQGRHRTGQRSSSRRMPARISMPRSGSARRRACSSSLARPARALAPTVEALPLMVCRVAALPSTSPSPSWRSSWAKRSCMSGTKRRNTSTISSVLPPKRPTISPRASTSSPASAAVAGALAPLLPR